MIRVTEVYDLTGKTTASSIQVDAYEAAKHLIGEDEEGWCVVKWKDFYFEVHTVGGLGQSFRPIGAAEALKEHYFIKGESK